VNFTIFLKTFSDCAVAPFYQGNFVANLNSSSVVFLNQQFFRVK